jgi:hypothetical protein
MFVRFACLVAVSIVLPLAATADEFHSATISGVKIDAMVSQPTPRSEADNRTMLENASKAPSASAIYRPPNTPAEASALTLPAR